MELKDFYDELTEVRVKGCHSKRAAEGTLRKTYCPASAKNPLLLICISMVLEGCSITLVMTTVRRLRKKRTQRSIT